MARRYLACSTDNEQPGSHHSREDFKARRRRLDRERLPPEEKRPPATTLDPSRRPESPAEAIWRFRATRMNQAIAEGKARMIARSLSNAEKAVSSTPRHHVTHFLIVSLQYVHLIERLPQILCQRRRWRQRLRFEPSPIRLD